MPKSTPTSLTQAIQHLFIQHNGEFRPADFLSVADELGFQLQPTPPDAPKLSYHSQQQPGAGLPQALLISAKAWSGYPPKPPGAKALVRQAKRPRRNSQVAE